MWTWMISVSSAGTDMFSLRAKRRSSRFLYIDFFQVKKRKRDVGLLSVIIKLDISSLVLGKLTSNVSFRDHLLKNQSPPTISPLRGKPAFFMGKRLTI